MSAARRKVTVLARNPEPEPGYQAPPPRWEIRTNGERVWCHFLADFGGMVDTSDPARMDLIAERATEAAAALREAQAPDLTLFEGVGS